MASKPKHLRLVSSQYEQLPGGTVPISTEFWKEIDLDEVEKVYNWGPDNVPEGALEQAIRVARATGDTALIEFWWRDDPFEI